MYKLRTSSQESGEFCTQPCKNLIATAGQPQRGSSCTSHTGHSHRTLLERHRSECNTGCMQGFFKPAASSSSWSHRVQSELVSASAPSLAAGKWTAKERTLCVRQRPCEFSVHRCQGSDKKSTLRHEVVLPNSATNLRTSLQRSQLAGAIELQPRTAQGKDLTLKASSRV